MNNYQKLIIDLSTRIPTDIIDLRSQRKRGTPPTQAFSDFLTHSEQGDWAENLVYNTIKSSLSDQFIPIKYGKSDKIIAGDPDFKSFYLSYQDELDAVGKRPDILLYKPNLYDIQWGDNISKLPLSSLPSIVSKACAGIEIRSSAYLTKKFVSKDDRPYLSFTPKVEDLLVVLKWIGVYGVPHYYAQVFFDAIYLIPFEKILRILCDSTITIKGVKNKKVFGAYEGSPAFAIEKNPKNQFKETIHIYLNQGIVIAEEMSLPDLEGKTKELDSGRLLHYVHFEGGQAKIKPDFVQIIQSVHE